MDTIKAVLQSGNSNLQKGYSMENLSTDYKDDILDTVINTKRRYRMTTNADGTVSFTDETSYAQTGTQYGAKDVNEERSTINEIISAINNIVNDVISEKIEDAFDAKLPVGRVIITMSATNPGTYLPGTWTRIAKGRTLVGVDESQTEFNAVEKSGGSKTHTLTVNEMPAHNHNIDIFLEAGGPTTGGASYIDGNKYGSRTTSMAGGGQPHNNLQPYYTVYFWKRTA